MYLETPKVIEIQSKALKRRYNEAKKAIEKERSHSIIKHVTLDTNEEHLKNYFISYIETNGDCIAPEDTRIFALLMREHHFF